MSKELAEIKATVIPQTKEIIESIADTGGLSVGEVLDRMVLNASPDSVDAAQMLILDNILISTKRLNQDQLNEVIYNVLKLLGISCDEPNGKEESAMLC